MLREFLFGRIDGVCARSEGSDAWSIDVPRAWTLRADTRNLFVTYASRP